MQLIFQWKEEKRRLKEQIRQLRCSNASDKQQLKEKIQALRAELQQKKQQIRRMPQEGIALARYVRDVTLPDGSEVAPGAQLVKVWRFRNESSKPWPEGSHLLWVGKKSDRLGAPESTPVPVCQPGQEVDVSVPLVAPAQAGRYTAYFRLAGPLGKRFGQRVWVSISVVESSSSSDEGTSGKSTDIPVDDLSKYATQLKSLAEMGYVNLKVNMRLLKKFDGNVERVVAVLIRRQQRQACVPVTAV
jgi:next-to-BRCA1 protein 1